MSISFATLVIFSGIITSNNLSAYLFFSFSVWDSYTLKFSMLDVVPEVSFLNNSVLILKYFLCVCFSLSDFH